MVKYINLALDDKDKKELLKRKGDKTWKEFLMGIEVEEDEQDES